MIRWRTRAGVIAAISIATPLLVPGGPVAASAVSAGSLLEQTVPPGARQVVSAIRLIDAVNARNRVYREASAVQRDLRAHYDAQIETARRQLLDREQLGLDTSQVRQYQRVIAMLTAERDAALALTEDDKRAAKFGFESTLRRELTDAIVRIPRVRNGLTQLSDTLGRVSGDLVGVRTAMESGHPLAATLEEVRAKLADFDKLASLGELIGGRPGRELGRISGRMHRLVDQVEAPTAEALGALDEVIGEVDALVATVDEQLASSRRVSAAAALREVGDQAIEAATQSALEVIGGAGGGPLAPARAAAAVIVRGRAADDGTTVTPSEMRSMAERVEAAILGRTNERIGDLCGRLVGAARRAQLAGAPTTAARQCTLYGNPEALQALIDARKVAESTTSTTGVVTPDSEAPSDPTLAPSTVSPDTPADMPADMPPDVMVFTGTLPAELLGTEVAAETNAVRLVVDDAQVVELTAEAVWSDADGTLALRIAGPSGPAPLADGMAAFTVRFTGDASGTCEPSNDLVDLCEAMIESFDALEADVPVTVTISGSQAELTFSGDGDTAATTLLRTS